VAKPAKKTKQTPEAYSAIAIIYNPNSTSGLAETRAKKLAAKLDKRGVKNVEIIPTKHAGHAETIAQSFVEKHIRPLLVSVSGDGGYNEVINGALAGAKTSKHTPVCTILAAGNANDHRRSVRKHPLSWAITKGQPEAVDILKLTARYGDSTLIRYAHSYIGLGITSHVAAELNQARLTRVREMLIVIRAFFNFEPLRVEFSNDRVRKIDSMVFANIHQMAKVVRIGKKTNLKNGLFKVVIVPHQTRFKFIYSMLKIAIFGIRKPIQREAVSFRIPNSEMVHLDGEIQKLPGGSIISVASEPGGLLTVR
jgi:diacylglycerol kinase (ATP)